ncbi:MULTISPECIES: sensor histidine kinase [unclassified Streptomyces]|uniref:sensor histidine kinase n=1 Tax=unclassified Streptomyces TaxID=2593676 RepID=UPI0007C93491|nr:MULTISPECIES: sensor histidine kinase [unclassified Streptomyces]
MRPDRGLFGRPGEGLRRPVVVDSLLAVGYATTALLLGMERPPTGWTGMDTTGAALTVLTSVVLVARRLAPVAVLSAVVVLWTAYIACGYWPVVNAPATLLALYTVAATRNGMPVRIGGAAVGVTWLLAGLSNVHNGSMKTVLVQAVAFPAVVVLIGRGAGRAAERTRELARLTLQLHAEQETRASQAVTEERVRIARELHDVVAHHMSVVSLQAGMASYVFEGDPATAQRALDTIAATSREALEELRRLLVLLRVGPEDTTATVGSPGPGTGTGPGAEGAEDAYAPAPGLERLDTLLLRVRDAGVPVDLDITGEPYPLPPGMDLCAYRVIQEALTNVLRHAGPATATVTVGYGRRSLTVRIADDGQGRVPADTRPNIGHGLIGMRERARIYQGTVNVGPRTGGGFEVLLSLPAPTADNGRPHGLRSPSP